MNAKGQMILLGIQKVEAKLGESEVPATLFYDGGSTLTLCLHSWAKKHGLQGRPVVVFLKVLGGEYQEKETLEYMFHLVGVDGKLFPVTAIGLDTITEENPGGDLTEAYETFPEIPRRQLERPEGQVELLIGQDYAGYLPRVEKCRDHLLLLKSLFGTGRLLSGRTGLGEPPSCHHAMTAQAMEMREALRSTPARAQVNHASTKVKLATFFEAEEMACEPTASCKQHRDQLKNCQACNYRGQAMSEQERLALERMEDSLVKLPEGKLSINYPFNEKAYLQKSNLAQARAIQTSVERSVVKKGIQKEFYEEMHKAREAGALVKLHEKELVSWEGPVHYVSYFPVINPDSSSTRVRIVSNSAMKNSHTGYSFNDTTDAVPNTLNDLYDVLIKWRCHEVCVMYDLSKAYQSIVTGPLEKHLRRIVFREPGGAWEVWAYNRVTFGDDPAACALELCKARCAQDAIHIDRQVATQLVDSSYVDDVAGGGTEEEVKRMVGDKTAAGYTGTIPQVLKQGGFKAKALVVGGKCDAEEKDALGGKFLGVAYDVESDQIICKLNSSIRAKHQKQQKGKAVQTVMWDDVFVGKVLAGEVTLTRRKLLCLVMSQFDPLGLAVPLTLKAKLMLRELYAKGTEHDWDKPLALDKTEAWLGFISLASDMAPISFPRSLHPNYGEKPMLIAFWDGSLVAHGACVYIRWELPQGGVDCRLVTAKTRVAPVSGATVQRMELQGLTTCVRLVRRVVEASTFFITRVVLAGDSMCCIMSERKSGMHYFPFFQNRIGEVQRNMEMIKGMVGTLDPLQKVEGKKNPADLCTRGETHIRDMQPGGLWQTGPDFLLLPPHQWELHVPDEEGHIPVNEIRSETHHLDAAPQGPSLRKIIRQIADNTRKLSVCVGAVARVVPVWQGASSETIKSSPTEQEREKAERLVVWAFMDEVEDAIKKEKLLSLNPKLHHGLWVTSGRYKRSRLVELAGKEELPIIMATSRLGLLYLIDSHEQDHRRDVPALLARSRKKVWLVGGRKAAKVVAKSCLWCRKVGRDTASQIMGKLPEEVARRAPPFLPWHLTCLAP